MTFYFYVRRTTGSIVFKIDELCFVVFLFNLSVFWLFIRYLFLVRIVIQLFSKRIFKVWNIGIEPFS